MCGVRWAGPDMEVQPEDRLRYALAGNAVLTLEGKTSRFTYRIEANEKQANASHWVYVLNGPNNETDFRFFGGIYRDGKRGKFYVSRRSSIKETAPSAQAFAWFWNHIEDPRVRVYHSGRCGRCGRTLTTPESIRTGLGPVCAERDLR